VSETGFDHDQLAVLVWRAERAGGDTKTPALPRKCVEALREHRVRQAKDRLSTGPSWKDHGLVFASTVGTPLDDHNVRRQFRVIADAAGLGKTWVPRELLHTFVSLLSAYGVPVEAIALLAEAVAVLDELENLIRRINQTNAATQIGPEGTITDALARRDVLRIRHSVVTSAADAAAGAGTGHPPAAVGTQDADRVAGGTAAVTGGRPGPADTRDRRAHSAVQLAVRPAGVTEKQGGAGSRRGGVHNPGPAGVINPATSWCAAGSVGFDSRAQCSPAQRAGDRARHTAHYHVQIHDDEGGRGELHPLVESSRGSCLG
jgi:hypothetical protein